MVNKEAKCPKCGKSLGNRRVDVKQSTNVTCTHCATRCHIECGNGVLKISKA
jgi:hypothetical protein